MAHCTKLTARVPLRPPSLSRQLSVARRGGVRGRQSFRGGRGHQSRLEVDRLVEKLIADEHDQREEAQLEVAERGEKSRFRRRQCEPACCVAATLTTASSASWLR